VLATVIDAAASSQVTGIYSTAAGAGMNAPVVLWWAVLHGTDADVTAASIVESRLDDVAVVLNLGPC
jgi:hypothetical protein